MQSVLISDAGKKEIDKIEVWLLDSKRNRTNVVLRYDNFGRFEKLEKIHTILTKKMENMVIVGVKRIINLRREEIEILRNNNNEITRKWGRLSGFLVRGKYRIR